MLDKITGKAKPTVPGSRRRWPCSQNHPARDGGGHGGGRNKSETSLLATKEGRASRDRAVQMSLFCRLCVDSNLACCCKENEERLVCFCHSNLVLFLRISYEYGRSKRRRRAHGDFNIVDTMPRSRHCLVSTRLCKPQNQIVQPSWIPDGCMPILPAHVPPAPCFLTLLT
jgi:hypothetical protein